MLPDYVYPRRQEMPSSSRAWRWTGVGVVMMVKAGRPAAGWMVLAAMVARSWSRVARLCTGWPSAVCLVVSLASAEGERPAGAGGPGGGGVVVFEQHGRELVLHVPGDVVGEHADQRVGADPAGEPVADRPDQQVGVQAAEHPLDVLQGLVGLHRAAGAEHI